MANTAAQFGFKHVGFLPGYAPDYQLTSGGGVLLSTYSTQIGFGDPIMKLNSTTNQIIQGTGALATTYPIMGIFQGCSFIPSGGGLVQWSPYWPGAASVNATAYWISAPGALFMAAALNTAISSGSIGQGVNFTTGAPTTTGGGYSVATLDQSTISTTAAGTTFNNLPFKVVSLYPGVGNGSDPTTAFNWVWVTFNFQTYRYGSVF